MYTLQHRETGSHWAEVENYSRRNSLCSYLNKPQIVLCVVPKCRSAHEQWCLRSCRSGALTGAVPALHWAPGAAQGGIRVLRRFLHQSWRPRLPVAAQTSPQWAVAPGPGSQQGGPRALRWVSRVPPAAGAAGPRPSLGQHRGAAHPGLGRGSALGRGCNAAVALASINPHLWEAGTTYRVFKADEEFGIKYRKDDNVTSWHSRRVSFSFSILQALEVIRYPEYHYFWL